MLISIQSREKAAGQHWERRMRQAYPRLIGACSALAIALGSQAALAQEAAPAGPETITEEQAQQDSIVVTGSRLRGAAPVGSTVIAVDRGAIVDSGAVSTDRLIQQIPQVLDLGVSENSRGQSGGSGNITY